MTMTQALTEFNLQGQRKQKKGIRFESLRQDKIRQDEVMIRTMFLCEMVNMLLIIIYRAGSWKKMSVESLGHGGHCKEDSQTQHQQGYFSEDDEPQYQPAFWGEVFPQFRFKKLLTESETSLIWLGSRLGSSSSELVLKITERTQSQTSRSLHQRDQKTFLSQFHLKRMVEVLEIHDSDDYRLIVMKYYPWNLEDLTRRFFQGSKRYTPSHLRFIGFAFRGMLRAVGELHKTGFVHRDLKLDNFMVDEQFNIYLNDFELVTREGSIDHSLSGTLDYMPPERLNQKKRTSVPIRREIDLWSLGVMLYELCTGTVPYHGRTSNQLEEEIYSKNVMDQDIPGQLMKHIQGMLEIRGDRRLSIDELSSCPLFQQEVDNEDLRQLIGL